MEENKFGVVLPCDLDQKINTAVLKGDTRLLFSLLVSYMNYNSFSLQDAASILLKPSRSN